jgi:hypothetical protein
MTSWGFDPHSIDRWSRAEGITKVVKYKTEREALEVIIKRVGRVGRSVANAKHNPGNG